ncbi:MAG: 50S ribosome-binding GTPase [Anaerolineales bacterium]|nr:50S ribosome-binding GTPase [Anaerolineales bacterium]
MNNPLPAMLRPSEMTLALVGNPNVGKSTLFNLLTGENQPVGNWAGKTVSHYETVLSLGTESARLVDLPGTYSLSAYSPEEQITRQFLLTTRPWLVINIVDAANLERNLYLTAQLLEMDMPLLVVLSMMDVAQRRGLRLNQSALSHALGVPVYEANGRHPTAAADLKRAIAQALGLPVEAT